MNTERDVTISKRYYWHDLDGGVLHKPKDVGPYYDSDNVNGWDGYESEDAAIAGLVEMIKKHGGAGEVGELVLVCEVEYACKRQQSNQ